MKPIYYKVTYPDGEVEYWTSVEEQEVQRLEEINNGKLIIEEVEGAEGGQDRVPGRQAGHRARRVRRGRRPSDG